MAEHTRAELVIHCSYFLVSVLTYLYVVSPIEPATWDLPPLRAMPVDNQLSNAIAVFEGKFLGAEHIHVDCSKKPCTAYTGLADGNIARWTPSQPEKGFEVLARTGCVDECPAEDIVPKCGALKFEHLCGRPLGMGLTPDRKTLLIVDPYKGLLALNLADKKLSRVASTYKDGEGNVVPMNFLNSLAVTKRGSVYLTMTSKKFERRDSIIEIMEGHPSGSLIVLRSWNQKTPPELITGNLTFANGVLVDEKEAYALVAETPRYRIKRVDLKTRTITTFIEDLQGTPDNLHWGVSKSGAPDYKTVWAGCPIKRSLPFSFANFLGDKSSMRGIFATIMHSTGTAELFYLLLPVTGMVARLKVEPGGMSGTVDDVLLDPTGLAATQVSHAVPCGDLLLMGSHTADVRKLMVLKT